MGAKLSLTEVDLWEQSFPRQRLTCGSKACSRWRRCDLSEHRVIVHREQALLPQIILLRQNTFSHRSGLERFLRVDIVATGFAIEPMTRLRPFDARSLAWALDHYPVGRQGQGRSEQRRGVRVIAHQRAE